MAGLSFIDRFLSLWIIVCMVGGVLLGNYVPKVSKILSGGTFADVSIPIAVGLLLMMYPVFCRVRYEKSLEIFKTKGMLGQVILSILINWIVAPLFMLGLAWATLPDLPEYRTGVILVGVARCIAMVLIWNRLAGGNEEYCAILVAINSILQIILYGPVAYLFVVVMGNGSNFKIQIWVIIRSVLVFLGIPLVAGFFTWLFFRKRTWYNTIFIPNVGKLSLISLLYVIIVMFSIQGKEIISEITFVLRTAVPLLIYFPAIFFGTLYFCLIKKIPYSVSVPQCFTAASNNFELAIAIAVGTYGVQSKEALAATIGPLIEVPMLVTLVYFMKAFKNRFEKNRKKVIFACVHNAGRSQMACEFFNLHNQNFEYTGISAGTEPADHVHPIVADALLEKGIDIKRNVPHKLTNELVKPGDILVTMGCGETCPYVPGVPIINWDLEDPKNQPIERVRIIRDDIEAKIKEFIKSEVEFTEKQ
ncbi:Arsenical-resistance protein Acr3 [Smittium culicis]|uniref:Arsenical-resistance protein Acr3 n=1 Tax=Smittium culicis TaxID=133412 RepID=A0A1R1X4M0_9FUNG|nr:Arsenical-resistance protein Acr3 [Smittium culicis]